MARRHLALIPVGARGASAVACGGGPRRKIGVGQKELGGVQLILVAGLLSPLIPRALVLVRRRCRRGIVALGKCKVSTAQHRSHGVSRVEVDYRESILILTETVRLQVEPLGAASDEESSRTRQAWREADTIDALRLQLGSARDNGVKLLLEASDQRSVGFATDDPAVKRDTQQLLL
eukprot:scaffold1692_cov133-Isochrysis_galbana.AAC.3